MLRLGAAGRRRQRLDVFEACFLRPKVYLLSSHRPHDSFDPPAICSCRLFSSYHNQHGDNSHQQRRRHRQRLSPRLRISKNNPYDVLGIPRDSSADTVKRKFLQLAMRHHPDTNRHSDDSLTHDSSKNMANNTTDTFVKIREAFERIKQDFKNNNSDTNSSSSWLTEEEFDAWFYEETGQKMDATTRREVMHVYRYVCESERPEILCGFFWLSQTWNVRRFCGIGRV